MRYLTNQLIVIMTLALITSCTTGSGSPPSNYQPSSVWMKQLGLVAASYNNLENFEVKHRQTPVVIQPKLSRALIRKKIIRFIYKPLIYNNDIHLSEYSILKLKVFLNPNGIVTSSERDMYIKIHPEWLPHPSATPVNWEYILIHHSATESSNAAHIHKAHLHAGYDEIGYHFVIGNGSRSGDGTIEVGSRWPKQKHGAHARADLGTPEHADNRYNKLGIGICLIGDFSNGRKPTKSQMESLVKLVKYLQKKYQISHDRVMPHKHVKNTQCPGESFPWEEFKSKIHH